MSQPPAGSSARKPAVLFVYYTYTQQTLKVAGEMAGVLRLASLATGNTIDQGVQ